MEKKMSNRNKYETRLWLIPVLYSDIVHVYWQMYEGFTGRVQNEVYLGTSDELVEKSDWKIVLGKSTVFENTLVAFEFVEGKTLADRTYTSALTGKNHAYFRDPATV